MRIMCDPSGAERERDRVSISVVIPTYNMAALVSQAVDSVLAQTVSPEEVIVVDDGSTDDTARRLEAYQGRIRCIRQENQGCSVARNLGVRAARGSLVAFLDADDVWHPRKLEIQRRVLEEHPEVGAVGTRFFDLPVARFPECGAAEELAMEECSWGELVVRTMFPPSSVLIRRALLQAVGLFDPSLRASEDRDLWCRLAQEAKVVRLKLPLTGMRDTRDSLSKDGALMLVNGCRRLRKLDATGAWRGRWRLRREAYSSHLYACSLCFEMQGQRKRAMATLLRSLWWYPLPYRVREVPAPLFRLKTLGVVCLRAMHLKAAHPPPSHPLQAVAG